MHCVPIPRSLQRTLRTIGALARDQGVEAYAVGGCVRDWLLRNRRVADVDVTVRGSGIELARSAAQVLGASLIVHQQFGTATMLLPPASRAPSGRGAALRIDVASCRAERYAKPAAYPRVRPGTLREDLFRRDFTINAMAVPLDPVRAATLIDPFGGGQDLRRRVLRVLHARSFLDDPSRILRGIRFARRFALRWDAGTEQAARAAVAEGALGWLNTGRLQRELDRFGEEPDPGACLAQLAWLL